MCVNSGNANAGAVSCVCATRYSSTSKDSHMYYSVPVLWYGVTVSGAELSRSFMAESICELGTTCGTAGVAINSQVTFAMHSRLRSLSPPSQSPLYTSGRTQSAGVKDKVSRQRL